MPTGPNVSGRGRKAVVEVESRPAKRRRGRAFASYEAALAFLNETVNVERIRAHRVDPATFKLDRMRAMLEVEGNPHASLRCVHVAGSKGKGSVCEMVASCMRACGYAVGLYTSPHLVDVRERVRVSGEAISEGAFVAAMSRARDAAKAVAGAHGDATYFELMTMAAFIHFAEQAVDLAVIEVGLGGRLDSTNVITPVAVGLTAIQLEHTAILGDTLAKIAAEKAGIMKPGVPAVSVPQAPEVLEVFRAKAAEVGCDLAVLGQEIDFSVRFESAHQMGPHARVCVTTDVSLYEHLPAPLPGEHQAQNCGLALAILDRLRRSGMEAPERPVAEGLAKTPRRGRMEMVWPEPRIMIDGAHTHESIRGLIQALGATQKFDSLVVIFGCSADKNIPAMLDEVGRGADKIIFTRASNNPRAADPADLLRRFEEKHEKMAQLEPTVKDAINAAYRAVGRGDLIVVTGSFHLAGEAKGLLEAKKRGVQGT